MFKSVGKTDIGLKRKVNQDFFMVGDKFDASWAIVCDGLGGAKAGDVASKRATEKIFNYLSERYSENMSSDDIKTMLSKACNLANVDVFDMGQENLDYSGMATTCAVSFIVGDQLHVVHVGDSRIYLLGPNGVKQLTKDDSFVQALIERGTLSEDQAKNHPQRNYLTKAIGIEKDIDINYECFKISKGDRVLICTDGLYNYLDEDILTDNFDERDVNLLVDKFIDLALEGGGSDNITIVVMFDDDDRDESRVR